MIFATIIAWDYNYSENTHFYRNCYSMLTIIILYLNHITNSIVKIPKKIWLTKNIVDYYCNYSFFSV